ncbi:hypothetical protein JHD47_04045 [Sulfurimonas sp. SAG-AH-194-L11]|nr:hypothetical protein [Sulfurimonas sp. SAG-AH-194-L11]
MAVALLFNTLNAIEFTDMYEISSKKDESTKFLVRYSNYEREFKFRWTLYVNEGLVLFHSYDTKLAQTILYLNTKNQSFKVSLKQKDSALYEAPYLLVKFKEFDFKENRAKFEIYLSDKKSQIKIEKIKKKS